MATTPLVEKLIKLLKERFHWAEETTISNLASNVVGGRCSIRDALGVLEGRLGYPQLYPKTSWNEAEKNEEEKWSEQQRNNTRKIGQMKKKMTNSFIHILPSFFVWNFIFKSQKSVQSFILWSRAEAENVDSDGTVVMVPLTPLPKTTPTSNTTATTTTTIGSPYCLRNKQKKRDTEATKKKQANTQISNTRKETMTTAMTYVQQLKKQQPLSFSFPIPFFLHV